jgi:hypothetical protein
LEDAAPRCRFILPSLREGNMSTPLVTTLRESCDYLRDGGYHQTAELMTAAANEIERLHREVRALESASAPLTALPRPGAGPRRFARPGAVPLAGT